MNPRSPIYPRHWRNPRHAKSSLSARVAYGALVLALLAVMANGADWMLLDAPAPASATAMATVIDVVTGDAPLQNDCTVIDAVHVQGPAP